MNKAILLAALLPMLLALANVSHASYIVNYINTTVSLNPNQSAQVTESLKVSVSNESVQQYTTDRLALNLTLSQWQNIIGPSLVQHIINPKRGIYDFNFLPGPLINSPNGKIAYLLMSYSVSNVTTANETGPRTFLYRFNNNVFNFQHGQSGAVLGENTTLTILLPTGASITNIYPIPDSPSLGFVSAYKNATKVSWNADEPLSQFTLTFTEQESLESEVVSFFASVYDYLGGFTYVIIAAVIAVVIIYTYLKAGGLSQK